MGPNGLPVWFCNRLECLLVLNGPVSPPGVTNPLFVNVTSSWWPHLRYVYVRQYYHFLTFETIDLLQLFAAIPITTKFHDLDLKSK